MTRGMRKLDIPSVGEMLEMLGDSGAPIQCALPASARGRGGRAGGGGGRRRPTPGQARRKLETEIQDHRQKISKYREQSLAVKTNEQYKALLHEIEFTEQQIRASEDKILEGMVDSETREAARMHRRAAAGKARDREIAAPPEQMQGANLADKARAGILEHAIALEKRAPN